MDKLLLTTWLSRYHALRGFLKYNFNLQLAAEGKSASSEKSMIVAIMFLLLPFLSFAQFPYNETFRGASAPSVNFGGAPTAFLTAASPSPIDVPSAGYLRLTNNTTNQKAYIYSDAVFFGNYGLKIEFEYFAHSATNGADGISFFLFDAAVTNFNIGGFGGSLGYAQLKQDANNPGTPGVSKGYLGIGLDEYGNFSNPSEGRQKGPGQRSNSVTLRGAGDGNATTATNYPWLETVRTTDFSGADNFTIAGGSRTDTVPSMPGYRKVFIDLKPRPGGGLLINVSIQHGSTVTKIFTDFPYTTAIPAKGLKYGIASSTGASVNFHEIRGLSLTVDPNNLAQPKANDDSRTTCQGYAKSVDLLTNDDLPNANGKVNEKTVDLDPTTPEVEQDITKPGVGRFVFDQTTLNLVFTPESNFNGAATINYNFRDVYGALSTTGKVTITTVLPVITQPANDVVTCEGVTSKTSVVVNDGGNGGSVTYQWQTLSGSNWTDISESNPVITGAKTRELTFVNTPYSLNGSKYRVVVTSTTGGCTALSNTATLTVNPKVDVNDVQSQVLCNGATTNAVSFSGPVNGTTFSWTNTAPSIGLAASGTGNIAAFTAVNTGSAPVTATIMVTAISPQGCAGNSKTFLITVHPTANVNQPASQEVCNQASTAAIAFSGSVAGTTFNWTNDTPSIGIQSSGSGDINSVTAVNTTNAVITATFKVTPTTAAGCTGETKTFTIKVYPTASILQPNDQELCNNANTAAVTFSGPVAGTIYNWTNDTPGIGLAASGTGDIASFKAVNTASTVVVATITVTPTTAKGCAGSSKTFKITVYPTANVVQPADQELCNTANTNAVNFTGDVAGTTYSWTNNTPSIGLAASGTGNIASFVAVNNGNTPVVATVTVTPTTAKGCAGEPKTFTITVLPTANVVKPADQELCNAVQTTAVNFDGTVAGTIYNWTNNTPSIGLAASGTGSIASFMAVNTGNMPIVATITVTPTTAKGCPGAAKSFTITVYPTANVVKPADQELCNTATTANVKFEGTVAGTIYNWTNNTPSIGLATAGTGDIAGFIAKNTGNTVVVATITVTPTTAKGCAGEAKTFTIAVLPTANVVKPADQELCNTANTTAVNFTGDVAGTIYTWTNDTPGIGLAASGTGDIAGFKAINTTNAAITATITVTPTTAKSCSGESKTFKITVLPTANVVQPADQELCNTANTAAVIFSGDVAGTIFNWTNDTPSIGLAVSGTGNIASFPVVNTGNTPVVATITVTPTTANNCAGEAKTFTITVLPTANVVKPADQEICNTANTTAVIFSGDVAGTIYNWTNDTPSIGLALSGMGDIASFKAINTTNAAITATITVTPTTAKGCPGADKSFTITVFPTANVVKPADQEWCNTVNTAAVNFTGDVAGTIYNWTNDTPGIGLAASGTGNIANFKATNTSSAAVTATITVTPTTAKGCAGESKTFTITVLPTATVAKPIDQELCNTANTAAVTFTGDVAGTVFNWTNDSPGIGLASSGTGDIASFKAINTTNAAIVATVSVIPTTAKGCAGESKTFTITVLPTANVAKPADQEVCNTASTAAVTFTGDVAGTIFNWTNDTPGIGLAASGTGNIASFSAVNASNVAVVATITVTPTTAKGCAGESKTFTVTVFPTANVVKPADQEICNTAATAAVNFSGDIAGTIYNWTNDTPGIGLAASGTGNIASFNAVNSSNVAVVATITVIPTTGKGCAGESKTFTVTVFPTANVVKPADQEICNTVSTAAVIFSGDVAGTIYNWTNDTPGIGLPASGTGNIASFSAVNTSNVGVIATITVTPTTAKGCAGAPKTFTITVLPTANVVKPADQEVCNTANTLAVNFAGDVAGTIYNWTNDTPGIGLAVSGSGDIASFNAANTGNTAVTATITVTPITAKGCAGESKTFTITVLPTANVEKPADQELCNTANTLAVNFAGDVAGTIYNWTNDTPGIGLAESGSGNIASFKAVNGTFVPVVATITVTPTTGKGCAGESKTFTITVLPTANVVKPADQELCNTVATAAVNFSGDVAGTIYNWTNDTPGIGLAASGTGNIASFNAVNVTNVAVSATITVTPTTAKGCAGESKTFTITVLPTANVEKPADQELCNTVATAAISFTGDVAGTIFNWTNDKPGIGLAASGTGNIASFNAINTTNVAVTATITVTPTTAKGCAGESKTFIVTVLPTANVVKPADQELCNTAATAAISFNGDVAGTIFNWTNDTPGIGLAASGTGNITSFNAINTTNVPVIATITVTPTTAKSCAGESKTFTITVQPTANVIKPADQELCNSASATAINFTGDVSGTIFNWTNNTPGIGLPASGTGNIASFPVVNTGNTAITATITVTPTTTKGCAGESKTFTIAVLPTANVVKPADQELCNTANTIAVNFTGDVTGTIFNWTNNTPGIGLAASGTGNIASFNATNTSNVPVSATITVTPNTAKGCAGESKTFTITVWPTANVAKPADQELCNTVNTAAVNFSGEVAGTIFNWTNDTPGIGLALSGSGDIASFKAVNTGNTAVTATITVTPTTVHGCAGEPKTFTITVLPTANVVQPAAQELCNTINTAAVEFSGSVAGTIYNWTNNDTPIGLAASGTGTISSFKAINTTHLPVTAMITVTPTTPGGCAGEAKSFTITVNPTANADQPAGQVLCNTVATAAVNFTGTVAGTIYNWTNDRPSIGLAASGTGNISSFTALNTTNVPVTATIRVTPTTASGCPGETKVFTIIVQPTANVLKPADQELCNATMTAAVNFSGDVAGTIYNWTNDTPGIGLASSGTGNIASFKAVNLTNAAITATIKIVPTTAAGCAGEVKIFTITVLPNASITLASDAPAANQSVCVNTAIETIKYTILNGTGAKVTGLPAGLTAEYLNGSFTITGVATQTGTFSYLVTTVGGCAVAELRGVIVVRPDVSVTLKSLPATARQSVCLNANINLISYQTVNATGAEVTGLPQGVTGTFVNGVLSINGVPAEAGVFNYKVVAAGLCKPAETKGTLTVYPPPIGFNAIVQSLNCENKALSYDLQENINNTAKGGNSVPSAFSWTVASNRNVTGQTNGAGNVINAVLINHSHAVQQLIYTVTPVAIAGGCPGKPFTITVELPVCSSITLTKTADISVVSQAGDQIRYTITVKNTGTAIHSGVVVKDPYLGGVLTLLSGDNGNKLLDANESWVYGGTYTVKQADIDQYGKPSAGSGSIVNTASVVTAEHPGELTALSTVAIVTTGKLALVKTGVMSADFSTIVYTFNITNTGKIRLNHLELKDPKISGQIVLSKAVIEVGETIMAQATYTVSDQEKRDGVVINSATATALTPAGEQVSAISGTDFNNNNPTEHIIDDAPQAINDNASTDINQPVKFTIADNDLPSFNGLDKGSIVIVSYPANGQISVNPDGTVVYTPNRGFSGQDQFTYTITDLKGKVSNVTLVSLNVIPIPLFIPNTFTPNGDGKNDTFQIIGRESFDSIELSIINRWGNEVYRSANYLDDWSGSGLNEGTYYYILTLKKGNDKVVKKGWILLKR